MTHITIERAKLEQALESLKRMKQFGNTFGYRSAEQNPYEQVCEAADVLEQVLAAPVQDAEVENMAVRSFLMLYGQPGVTVGQMKKHMSMSGFKSWPAWVETEHDGAHLTKAGAQLWIRYLFSLDATPHATQPTIDKSEGICNECETVAHCMKNGCIPKQPAHIKKPVAWLVEFESGEQELHFDEPSVGETRTPLYTTQPAAQYPLPDDLYDSKDWRATDYAGRVELIHSMYEAKKLELDAYLDAAQPAPTGQAPCARHCEATAFKIVIRNLNGDIDRLKAQQNAPEGWSFKRGKNQTIKLTSPMGTWWIFSPETDGPDRITWEFLDSMLKGVGK